MENRAAHLIICVGTLAGLVAARLKQACAKSADYINFVRLLVLDTAWDDLAFEVLEEREKFVLQGLPVSEIKSNPAAFPAFKQIVVEQMENVGQLAAGAMRPTTTYAALVWKYQELESRILVALQELGALPSDGPASIYVVGSSASTTGRGTWLEALMASHRVVRKLGTFHPIYGVAIDSEGLAPDQLALRQRNQGTFYRELERADLSSQARPIPRPHDIPWTFGRPADHVFRFCGATQDGNLTSVDELMAHVTDWMLTTLVNPVVHHLVSGPKGDRARLLPNVARTDGHPLDPRSRYFNCSGVSAITLNTASVNQYVEAERGFRTLDRIRGIKQPEVQNLMREFRLQYDALTNEAEEVLLLAKVSGQIRELRVLWDSSSLDVWHGHVQNTKHNLAKLIEQATATVAARSTKAITRIADGIDARLTSFLSGGSTHGSGVQTLGLNGCEALLKDAIKQADEVSQRATAQTSNSVKVAESHRAIEDLLGKLGGVKMWKKRIREEILRILEATYAQAMRTVVAEKVQDAVIELRTRLDEHLKVVRKALGVVGLAFKELEEKKAKALALNANGSIHYLLTTEVEMQAAAADAKLIQSACVESATEALIGRLGTEFHTVVANLADNSPDELARQAIAENTAIAPIAADLKGYFPSAFEARYARDEERVEALRWLVRKSRPLSGRVDPMLDHRLPADVRPAFQRNQGVLVPTKLAPKLAPVLAQLGVPANRIRSIDELDAIVCVDELLGLPAHAFPYLQLVGGLVSEDRDARAATTIARWGCDWLPKIENADPCSDWSPKDHLIAGMMIGVVKHLVPDIVFHPSGQAHVTLGSTVAAAAAAISQDGVCHGLKKAIKAFLEKESLCELHLMGQRAVTLGVPNEEVALVARKLQTFHGALGR